MAAPADKLARGKGGALELFSMNFCWCIWFCQECDRGSLTPVPRDRNPFDTRGKYVTYGKPYISNGESVDSPNSCACNPPGEELPCDDCDDGKKK